MLEFKTTHYNGINITLYRIVDHLWISNAISTGEHLVKQFNYDKMMWMQSIYTTDEIESIFNISKNILK